LEIYPLNMTSGTSGLFFTPDSAVLPVGSFQINALMLYGSFSIPEKTAAEHNYSSFILFPIDFSFRFSVLNKTEFAGSFNGVFSNSNNNGFGFTVSAKYSFLSGTGDLPFGLAAGISYNYSNNNGELPISAGRGLGLYVPMSLKFSPVKILFGPGMLWHGSADPVPRLLFNCGVMFRGSWYTLGFSAREEFDFTNKGSRSGISFQDRLRFHTGLEANFYLRPSNFVISVLGGLWVHGDNKGGFGGLSLGIIH